MAQYVIPWVRMRRGEEYIRTSSKKYPVLEPFGPRNLGTFFNNNKDDSNKSAYERLHAVQGFDPSKPRCDRAKQSIYWSEIYEENIVHKVPMISSHWYGRPNRIQVDSLGKGFNRVCRTKEFYTRSGVSFVEDDEDWQVCKN